MELWTTCPSRAFSLCTLQGDVWGPEKTAAIPTVPAPFSMSPSHSVPEAPPHGWGITGYLGPPGKVIPSLFNTPGATHLHILRKSSHLKM